MTGLYRFFFAPPQCQCFFAIRTLLHFSIFCRFLQKKELPQKANQRKKTAKRAHIQKCTSIFENFLRACFPQTQTNPNISNSRVSKLCGIRFWDVFKRCFLGCFPRYLLDFSGKYPYIPCDLEHFGAKTCSSNAICNILSRYIMLSCYLQHFGADISYCPFFRLSVSLVFVFFWLLAFGSVAFGFCGFWGRLCFLAFGCHGCRILWSFGFCGFRLL